MSFTKRNESHTFNWRKKVFQLLLCHITIPSSGVKFQKYHSYKLTQVDINAENTFVGFPNSPTHPCDIDED